MCKLNNQISLLITINFFVTVPSIRYNISLSSVYLTSSCYFCKKSNVQQTPSSWQPKPAFGSWFISDGQMFTKRSYQNGTSENDLLPSRASWFRCQVLMPELEKLSSHISLIARHHPNVGKKKQRCTFQKSRMLMILGFLSDIHHTVHWVKP